MVGPSVGRKIVEIVSQSQMAAFRMGKASIKKWESSRATAEVDFSASVYFNNILDVV